MTENRICRIKNFKQNSLHIAVKNFSDVRANVGEFALDFYPCTQKKNCD